MCSKCDCTYVMWMLRKHARTHTHTHTHAQVSNSGYTSDNVPGLRIVVDGWDAGSSIYVELHMKEDAPSYDMAVVVYQVLTHAPP